MMVFSVIRQHNRALDLSRRRYRIIWQMLQKCTDQHNTQTISAFTEMAVLFHRSTK